ncbi:MAG: T9SS type A sorting domain-containing protein [Flavobacteriales bacterium]|nr:T9SS type A sorting domain-containing protein [Flavobacteriales bacterium]
MTSYAMNNRWCRWAAMLAAHCLLFLAAQRCEAQTNLVPNGSFEETDSCLEINTWYYPETGPLGWFSTAGSGDYCLSCLPYGAFNGVPLSAFAFQYPQDGLAYVGVITYHHLQGREYFAIELTQPLQVGNTYYASFYVSASWNGWDQQCWMATSHIGLRFTMEAQQYEFGDPLQPLANAAQVYHPTILADTVNWVLVSGSFVADSAYRYVSIGNHFDNAQTDTLHFVDSNAYPRAHTLIDNVCVSTDPLGCPLANGVVEAAADQIVLFPNPVDDVVRIRGVEAGLRITIHDVCGRLLWQDRGTGGELHWEVGDSAPGLYMLRVEQTGGYRSFKFVVKE